MTPSGLAGPLGVVAVGFGEVLRERSLVRWLDAAVREESLTAHIAVVTALAGGRGEFDHLVRPFFDARGLPVPAFVPRLDDALAAGRGAGVRAAVITTPNALHHGQAVACLEAGLHVFVERPLVPPTDHLPELVAAAGNAGLLLYTGTQRRTEAPFRYLHDAVARQHGFGELASVHCALSVGEPLDGWRADPRLAGGGIVVDTGYHQLDCAAWLASATGHTFDEVGACAALFASRSKAAGRIETTATGHILTRSGLTVSFDLSSAGPLGSVHERVEARDRDGARIVVSRDQSRRTTAPGTVTHQRADGQIVTLPPTADRAPLPLDGALLNGTAKPEGPLGDFLSAAARSHPGHASGPHRPHPCEGRESLATWHLVRAIRRHAVWQEDVIR
jgi:predicted dehydrogenase